jgi:HPt (histidine-containing phosphotransfer) domain-containing protein
VVVSVAHTLKGSSANVGAREFAERCAAVHQQAASDASNPDLRNLVGALSVEFKKVRSALESYRAGL